VTNEEQPQQVARGITPVFRIGPNNPSTYLHRKVVSGGNPWFTPYEANTQGINLPDVQPLRGAQPPQ
jgi:hypothetical protein